jgi:hypothetical protein
MTKRRIAFLLIATGTATAAAAQSTPPAPPPPACTAAEHRQFDFWVGRWDVYPTGKDNQVANSLIERLYDGCVIRENWMPRQGAGGTSVNNYIVEEGRWHQTWVSGRNARVDFHGGLVDGKMVLTGFWPNSVGPGKHGLIRMTYSKQADGSVRQHGQVSADYGLTWSDSFDFTYRPSAAAK